MRCLVTDIPEEWSSREVHIVRFAIQNPAYRPAGNLFFEGKISIANDGRILIMLSLTSRPTGWDDCGASAQ